MIRVANHAARATKVGTRDTIMETQRFQDTHARVMLSLQEPSIHFSLLLAYTRPIGLEHLLSCRLRLRTCSHICYHKNLSSIMVKICRSLPAPAPSPTASSSPLLLSLCACPACKKKQKHKQKVAITSRNFGINVNGVKETAMVPYADMLNFAVDHSVNYFKQ